APMSWCFTPADISPSRAWRCPHRPSSTRWWSGSASPTRRPITMSLCLSRPMAIQPIEEAEAHMTGRVRFLLGTERREVEVGDPTMTVLNYLRLVERRTGTKEGCAEGDCGACTVVLGELEGDRLAYRAVNSCIQFLPTLAGKQLLTVEDLATSRENLH